MYAVVCCVLHDIMYIIVIGIWSTSQNLKRSHTAAIFDHCMQNCNGQTQQKFDGWTYGDHINIVLPAILRTRWSSLRLTSILRHIKYYADMHKYTVRYNIHNMYWIQDSMLACRFYLTLLMHGTNCCTPQVACPCCNIYYRPVWLRGTVIIHVITCTVHSSPIISQHTYADKMWLNMHKLTHVFSY